jgi:HEAT repeat protein
VVLLFARLNHVDPGVRRIAAMDLARLAPDDPHRAPAADAVATRLEAEADDSVRCRLVRTLGKLGNLDHLRVLARIRDDAGSSPQLAHDALLAFDLIEHRSLSGDVGQR